MEEEQPQWYHISFVYMHTTGFLNTNPELAGAEAMANILTLVTQVRQTAA